MAPTVVALTMAIIGCGSAPRAPVSAAGDSSDEGATALPPIGDRAALTVFLRPDRWEDEREAWRALLEPVLAPDLLALLRAPTLVEAASRLATAFDLTQLTLDGLDETRPIALALGESVEGGLADAIAASRGAPFGSMRHRLVLPAADSDRLEAGIAQTLGGMRCAREGTRYVCGDLTFDVKRAASWIVVTVGATHGARIAEPGPAVRTAALAYAFDADALVSVYARPHRVAELVSMSDAAAISGALEHVDPSYREQLWSTGVSELLGSLVRNSMVTAEIDDVALALALPSVVLVAGLTDHGTDVLTAGRARSPAPGATAVAPTAMITLRTGLDTDAMRAAAGVPFGFTGVDAGPDLAAAYFNSGMIGRLQIPFSRPTGMLSLLAPPLSAHATIERRAPSGDVLAELTLDSSQLGRMFVDEGLARMAIGLGTVHARLTARGRTLILSLALRGGDPASIELPAPDGPPIGGSSRRSAAMDCFERVVLGTVDALSALPNAAPDQQTRLREAARAEISSAATCALGDPSTRVDTEAVQSLLGR